MNIFQIKYLVPLLTFLLGFFAMLLISIKLKAFWYTSVYNFPLVSIPSVLIGDSILLPLINFHIYKLLKYEPVDNLLKTYSSSLIILIIISFIISSVVNFSTHYMWLRDQYTSYTETVLGKMSLAGWWHLAFSIIQVTIIITFVGIWYLIAIKGLSEPFIYAFSIWKIVLVFTSLSIFDFVIRNLYIFKNKNLLSGLKNDWNYFIPLILSLIVFVMSYVKLKKI